MNPLILFRIANDPEMSNNLFSIQLIVWWKCWYSKFWIMFISYDMIYQVLICPNRDISSPCRTKIQMGVRKLEMLMLQGVVGSFALSTWLIFIAYFAWFFTSGKDYAPMARRDAEILWRIHKQDAECKSNKWQEIRHKENIVGFECECGYRHLQKRPITTKTHP